MIYIFFCIFTSQWSINSNYMRITMPQCFFFLVINFGALVLVQKVSISDMDPH